MKLRQILITGTVIAGLSMIAGNASAGAVSGICPAIGYMAGTSCNVEITAGPGGAYSTLITNSSPYDGADDNLVGFINNSGSTINFLTLSGHNIFNFDGDGLQSYNNADGNDPTGYGGETSNGQFVTFNITSKSMGTIFFGDGGLANGASAYFSLEGPPSVSITPVPVPEPGSLLLLGSALLGLGFAASRRRVRRCPHAARP